MKNKEKVNKLGGELISHLRTKEKFINDKKDLLDKLKGDIVSTICNELKTPISRIAGYTELSLQKNGFINPDLKENLEKIQSESAKLKNNINGLISILDFYFRIINS
jgi:signal transduction histidine kinase